MKLSDHLSLVVLCALAAATFYPILGIGAVVALGLVATAGLWYASRPRWVIRKSGVDGGNRWILRMGELKWSMDDFCRGWLITGRPGTGKTTAAINQMLWQVSKSCPNWGGVCVDDKGLYWETLKPMFRHLGHEDKLILLQVRPEGAGPDWKPAHTFNFLDDPHLTDDTKAELVCNVAGSFGQRSEQTFFKKQAESQIGFAFKALRCAGLPVTLENTYEFLTTDNLMREVMDMLEGKDSREASELLDHFKHRWLAQPPEQLGGIKTTVANYLKGGLNNSSY